MGVEFEDRDLTDAVFWGVDLRRSRFRDTDLSGSRFFHTRWSDVVVDGVVERLVVNGVDVTEFVNTNDRWFPLRTRLEPTTGDELRWAWATLSTLWASVLDRVSTMGDGAELRSVDGEWSLRDTLRHLVFAMDKWFWWPITGHRSFEPIGLPNTGSQSLDWPGIDRDGDPTFDEVLTVRRSHVDRFTAIVADVEFDDQPHTVDVMENGTVPAAMCFHVVLEEEFEHLRYVVRDLDTLEGLGSARRP